MDSDYIKGIVLEWLRFKARCALVMTEKTPGEYFDSLGRPDCIGVRHNGQWIEVEVKTTMADFRADESKRIMQYRGSGFAQWPWKFYYAVPHKIHESVKAELGDKLGLMAIEEGCGLQVVKGAKQNPAARKLNEQGWKRAFQQQSNEIVSVWRRLNKERARNRQPQPTGGTSPFGEQNSSILEAAQW